MSALVLIESTLELTFGAETRDVLKSYEFSDVEAAKKFVDELNAIPKGNTAFNKIEGVLTTDLSRRSDYNVVVSAEAEVPLVIHCIIVNSGDYSIEYDGIDVLTHSEVLDYRERGIHPGVIQAYYFPFVIEPVQQTDEDGNRLLPEFDDEFEFYMGFDPDFTVQVKGLIAERQEDALGVK